MKERNHIYYFDYLRIFAFISVIYMHTAAGLLRNGININWYTTNIFTSLAFMAVPLFFMMSGYLLMSSKKTHNLTVLFSHRLPRLVMPFVFWSLAGIFVYLFFQDNLSFKNILITMADSLENPVYIHMWYMYTLIALYLISPFLITIVENLDSRAHQFLFALIVIVNIFAMAKAIIPMPYKKLFIWDIFTELQFFNGHICAFLLGYYLGKSDKKVNNVLLLIIFTACFATITCGTWYLTKTNGEYTATFQAQKEGFEVLMASSVFLLAKQNLNKACNMLKNIITPVVTLSLPVYLVHGIVLSVLSNCGIYIDSFGKIVLVTITVFLISFFITKTLSSVKPLSYITTGMSYDEVCNSANWQYTVRNIIIHRDTKQRF